MKLNKKVIFFRRAFVCLFIWTIILIKFSRNIDNSHNRTWNRLLEFVGDRDHGLDPGIFNALL